MASKTKGTTFVHVMSESSDHYYFTFDGQLSDKEVRSRIESELSFEDPDLLYVEHVERSKPKS